MIEIWLLMLAYIAVCFGIGYWLTKIVLGIFFPDVSDK